MDAKLNKILSEIDELKERVSQLPTLHPLTIERINKALNIEYTYEAIKLEGGEFTLSETAIIIMEKLTAPDKPLTEQLLLINHFEAIQFIRAFAALGKDISKHTIREIQFILSTNIDVENGGKYRDFDFSFSYHKTKLLKASTIPTDIKNMIINYKIMEDENMHPVIIAARLHADIIKIMPFFSFNELTARLLMNLYLLKNGFPMVNIKNAYRAEYNAALRKMRFPYRIDKYYSYIAEEVRTSLEYFLHFYGAKKPLYKHV